MTPESISYGSKRRVWWRCGKGHEWQALVTSRTSNHSACPYCTGRVASPGVNDLATLYPGLIVDWHPTKNGTLTADQVLPGSHRKVWWRCEKGHEWQAIVKSRTEGSGCPVCANREVLAGENDMATTHPQLALQWHPVKNGALKPQNVVAGSSKKVWWMCEKGHEWRASVISRTSGGSGCPVCAGKVVLPGENDLASRFPAIAAEWDPRLNDRLTPQTVSPYSNCRAWWRCARGHVYQAAVEARTSGGSGCPYCSGRKVLTGFNDLSTLEPEISAQWHPTLNDGLTPQMVTVGSKRKVWWMCSQHHAWKAIIYSRTGRQRCGCPVCAGSAKAGNLRRSQVH